MYRNQKLKTFLFVLYVKHLDRGQQTVPHRVTVFVYVTVAICRHTMKSESEWEMKNSSSPIQGAVLSCLPPTIITDMLQVPGDGAKTTFKFIPLHYITFNESENWPPALYISFGLVKKASTKG